MYEKELCVKLAIYKDYTEMHGQQNIKFCHYLLYLRSSCWLYSPLFISSFQRPVFVYPSCNLRNLVFCPPPPPRGEPCIDHP